jgi:hypothetical protein
MAKRLNAAEAIANVLGWDIQDVLDNRYHAGRTTKPVYCDEDYYYCAGRAGDKPAKHIQDKYRWGRWEMVAHPANNANNWVVWRSK